MRQVYTHHQRSFLPGVNTNDHPSALLDGELAGGSINFRLDRNGRCRKRFGTSPFNETLIAGGGPILGLHQTYDLFNAGGIAHNLVATDIAGKGTVLVKVGVGNYAFPRNQDDSAVPFVAGNQWSFVAFHRLVLAMNGQSGILPQVWDGDTGGNGWYDLGISNDPLVTQLAVGPTSAARVAASGGHLPIGTYRFVFVLRMDTGAGAGYRSGPSPVITSKKYLVEVTAEGDMVQFTSPPYPTSATYTFELYATEANGGRFYRVAEFKSGGSGTYDWKGLEADEGAGLGPELFSLFASPPPTACVAGAVFDGRLFLADKGRVYWSDPGNPHNFDLFAYADISGGRDITGLIVTRERLVVLTEDAMFRVVPAGGVYLIQEVGKNLGCIAPGTVKETGNYLCFLGRKGVMAVSSSGLAAFSGTEVPDTLVSEQITPDIVAGIDNEKCVAVSDGFSYYLAIQEPGAGSRNCVWEADFSRPVNIGGIVRLARWTKYVGDSGEGKDTWGFTALATDREGILGGSSTTGRVVRLFDPLKTNEDYIHSGVVPDGFDTAESPIPMVVKTRRFAVQDMFFDVEVLEYLMQWSAQTDLEFIIQSESGNREQRFTELLVATGGVTGSVFPREYPIQFGKRDELDMRSASVSDRIIGRTFRITINDKGEDSSLEFVGFGLMCGLLERRSYYVS